MPQLMEHTVGYGLYLVTGAPSDGTDEVQSIVKDSTVTAGTFRLAFEGFVTAPISWTATTAILETALNNLPSIGNGGTGVVGVVVTNGPLPGTALTITFSGSNVSKRDVGLLTVYANNLTGGGTMAITVSTPGVTATHKYAPRGALLIRTDAGTLFQNTSATAGAPTWTGR